MINIKWSALIWEMIVEKVDSSGESEGHIEVPQHAKILIIISTLIMLVGFAYLLILLTTYIGVGIGFTI